MACQGPNLHSRFYAAAQYIIPALYLPEWYLIPTSLQPIVGLLDSEGLLTVGLFTAVALAYLREDSKVTFLRVTISGLGLVVGTIGGAEVGAYVIEIGWNPTQRHLTIDRWLGLLPAR